MDITEEMIRDGKLEEYSGFFILEVTNGKHKQRIKVSYGDMLIPDNLLLKHKAAAEVHWRIMPDLEEIAEFDWKNSEEYKNAIYQWSNAKGRGETHEYFEASSFFHDARKAYRDRKNNA